jgi:DNA-binding response OmpR family regulator
VRILLVEDSVDDRFLIHDLLAEFGEAWFRLDTATTVETGLEVLGRGEYDVCLCDYRLGGGTGLDLLRQVVEGGCPTPVVLLTGQGSRQVDVEAMWAGAADYLEKHTLTASLLERTVRYAMERSRLVRRARLAEHQRNLAVELAGHWPFRWTRDRDELAIDPRLLDRLGYAENTPRSLQEWMRRLPLADVAAIRNALTGHLDGATDHVTCRLRIRTRDDDHVVLTCRAVALRDVNGVREITGVVAEPSAATSRRDRAVGAHSLAAIPMEDWRAVAETILPDLVEPVRLLVRDVARLQSEAATETGTDLDWLVTNLSNQAACTASIVEYLAARLGVTLPPVPEPDPAERP